ncbi:MAG TPA: radical SAM protein, partial [Anaerolineae bacterium]|nr:radical SAM protein [Anaerolineae bacterium]
MSSMDIVLVKPGSQKQLYGELSTLSLTAIEPPLWAALLAAHLRKQGYSIVLFDAEVENWNYEQTAKKISEVNPMLAAIVVSGTNPSASTMNMTGVGAILIHLKELAPEIKTLLLGLHPSALPERTLVEEQVDFVCEGEGIYSLPQLLDSLKVNREEYPIEGLWYKKEGKVVSNPRAPLVKNLDELPMPAWDLLPMEKYRAHNWHCFDNINVRQPYAVIYTSLGCPFRCSFCCINVLFGKHGIRYRSPDLVINEIDYLVKNHGVRNIKILDEMFVLKESHVVHLCNLIIERGYNLNMWAYARVDTVNETMLRKMKQAGINWVCYGIESGTEKVLKGAKKGYDLALLDRLIKMSYEVGLHIAANYVFGLPDDDHDSMGKTLELAMEINAEWANFYSAMAYPGSQLYRLAIKEGWSLPETWQGYSQYSYETRPLPTKHLSETEVLRFRDYAFQLYFNN